MCSYTYMYMYIYILYTCTYCHQLYTSVYAFNVTFDPYKEKFFLYGVKGHTTCMREGESLELKSRLPLRLPLTPPPSLPPPPPLPSTHTDVHLL